MWKSVTLCELTVSAPTIAVGTYGSSCLFKLVLMKHTKLLFWQRKGVAQMDQFLCIIFELPRMTL